MPLKNSDVSQLIAEEMAHNHLKMKSLEVADNSLQEVRAYFGELDFALSSSSLVANNKLHLMGDVIVLFKGSPQRSCA